MEWLADVMRSIMIVAGEASGDLHGATLATALRTLTPQCRLVGMGGPKMRAAGVEVREDVTAAAAVGWTEAVSRVPRLYGAYRRLTAMVARERPAALVVIDFPEFNLRLAAAASARGVPVVYFIAPQIWAWRGGRIRAMRRRVSLVLAIFPFEVPLYRAAGVPVEFVGHPVLDALTTAPSRVEARRQLGIADDALVIGLLPGSRREEIDRVLPIMREATARIGADPPPRFLVALAPTVTRETAACHLDHDGRLELVEAATYSVIRAADVLLVASGTASLEAAVLGTPMAVCYRVSRLTEIMSRSLVRVPWISVVNLALGRQVVPELYQANATGASLAAEASRLIRDAGARRAQSDAFAELRTELGDPGVGARAARCVLAAAGAS
ncbi:MAG: lipid-A-disaccharide synthase [Candidatus Rokuibacteriota bacterium]|nr:MAG: lipid-A-disaccharide synthase [Candidatus Rokubacteria bacterium]